MTLYGSFQKAVVFLSTAVGIYTAYLTQGIVSEKLSTDSFDGSRFEYMSALPMLQSATCFLVGLLLHFGFERKKGSANDYPPVIEYWRSGLSSTVGPAMGYASLRNISYPAQVVVKSCKMIPVMVMGSLLYGIRYPAVQWLITGGICTGLALFSSASAKAASRKLAEANMLLGYGLCFANLTCDGFTNSNQDVINRKYPKNSALHMMCVMNLWQAVYYVAWFYGLQTFGFGDAFGDIFRLAAASPAFRSHLLQFCLCGAFGQLCIFRMIKSQGSLTNTLVTTTRKFFSILLSVFLNGTVLVWQQWVGVVLVFYGVMWSIQYKHSAKANSKTGKQNGKSA
ncbi:hypothetical protein BSKO_12475 [Bryopsis sp. KO-2023]|nr:hypothetical protein BSKO_12475 [Bryopsis sp. KO-2023]